jgi:hypothetical protein
VVRHSANDEGSTLDVVLRFAALRPRQNTDAPPLTLDSGSSFQSQVRDTISSQQPRPETEAIARRFAETDFVRDLDHAAHGHALAEVLARRRNGELRKPALVASAVLEAVGDDDAASFAGELARARDSVLAAYLLPERLDAGAAQDLVRGYTLADGVADGDLTDERIDAIVGGPMALPDFVVTRPNTPAAATQDAEERARELATEIEELAGRRDALAGAIAEMALHVDDELELNEFGERRPLRDLYRAGVNGVSNRDGAVAEAAREKPALAEFDDSAAASPLLRASVGRNIALSQHAVEAVPDDVATTIHTLGLDLTTTPVEEVQRRITDEHARVSDQLLASAGELANLRPGRSIINEIGAWALDPVDDPERPAPVASAAPTTHTAVKPLGIADLMVVRVHIDRYERSEVAAVENVLPHEKLPRHPSPRRHRDGDDRRAGDDRPASCNAVDGGTDERGRQGRGSWPGARPARSFTPMLIGWRPSLQRAMGSTRSWSSTCRPRCWADSFRSRLQPMRQGTIG